MLSQIFYQKPSRRGTALLTRKNQLDGGRLRLPARQDAHQPPTPKRSLDHLVRQEGDTQTRDGRLPYQIEIGGPQSWLETDGLAFARVPHQRMALAHRIFVGAQEGKTGQGFRVITPYVVLGDKVGTCHEHAMA